MIFNDPTYCMGNRSLFKKFAIALQILKNPWTLLGDKLGLLAHPRYYTKTGVTFYTRGRTTDVNDAVVVLSGNEYPPALVNLAGADRPVVVDCGGHIGTFSLYAHSLNPTVRLYIMEPSADNVVLLKKNLGQNGLTDAVIIDKALYGTSGRYYLDIDDKPFDAGQLVRDIPASHKYLTIDALTLREVLEQNRLDSVDLLKLDIEGSEYDVMEKDFAYLSKTVKRLVMEYHVSANSQGRDIIENHLVGQGTFELIYESKNVLGFINKGLR